MHDRGIHLEYSFQPDDQRGADVHNPLFELLQVWAHSSRIDYGYELKGAMNLAPPITEKTTIAPR